MKDCSQCVVRNRAICAGLEPDELDALGQLGRKQRVTKGHTVVWEGDDSVVVANVIEGVLKVSMSISDGREQIVGLVFASDLSAGPLVSKAPTASLRSQMHNCAFSPVPLLTASHGSIRNWSISCCGVR